MDQNGAEYLDFIGFILLFPTPFLIALKLRGCKINQSMQRSFSGFDHRVGHLRWWP